MNGPETRESQTKVLVVGAGPTGLMATVELARRGVAVWVVEKATERSPLSKALVVQARTLEMMDLSALSDEFVRRGYRAPGFNVGLNSRKKPISVDMQGLDTRFPCMLVLPQGETEEILEKVKSTYQNLALFVYRSMAKKEVALWQESMV